MISKPQVNTGQNNVGSGAPEPQALLRQAVAFHRAGALAEAEQLYREILRLQPQSFDSLHLLGVVYYQRGQLPEALQHIEAALKINRQVADAYNNRGNVLVAMGRFEDAVASYDKAIVLRPTYAEAFVSRGNALRELGRLQDALASCDRAITLRPDYAEAFYNRGNALAAQKQFKEAHAQYDRAIALRPNYAEAFNNRGGALQELGVHQDALADFDSAIALKPDYAEAFNNRGLTLSELRKFEAALASHDRAIALKPDYAGAFNNRGAALMELGRFERALEDYDRAIELAPDYVDAYCNRATALQNLNRWDAAVADYERAAILNCHHKNLTAARLHAKMHLCRWDGFAQDCAEFLSAIAQSRCAPSPFALLPIASTPADQLRCAQLYVADACPESRTPLWQGERYAHDRIRIAYLSADFHDHATAHLAAGLFERHDRTRFETMALSFGPAQDSAMRQRLVRAFDRFIDVRAHSDQMVAEFVRGAEVDVAVDLKGYTQDARSKILALRPAPIQVSYLGYPGTMGAPYIDYLIADPCVIPSDQHEAYAEKIVYLPDCYQINDVSRPIAENAPSRASAGLPEDRFVFCCFNNNYKITPDVFDIWMRLLAAIDGSVLWLLAGNSSAPGHLRAEAERRGVAPDRLIFAERIRMDKHLARHRLADLFLDTLYYTAHTTASDALWAGLPVLTCAGATFASRVAASLLTAVGLPELITSSLADYQALALKLARDPGLLADVRQRLARNRTTSALFDTERTTRHLESAYLTMWEHWKAGAAPRSFAVGGQTADLRAD